MALGSGAGIRLAAPMPSLRPPAALQAQALALPVAAPAPAPADEVSPAGSLRELASLVDGMADLSRPEAGAADLKSGAGSRFDGGSADGAAAPPASDPAGPVERAVAILDKKFSPGQAIAAGELRVVAGKLSLGPDSLVRMLTTADRLVRLTDGSFLYVHQDIMGTSPQERDKVKRAFEYFRKGDVAGYAAAISAFAVVKQYAVSKEDGNLALIIMVNASMHLVRNLLGRLGAASTPELKEALAWLGKNHCDNEQGYPQMPVRLKAALRDYLRREREVLAHDDTFRSILMNLLQLDEPRAGARQKQTLAADDQSGVVSRDDDPEAYWMSRIKDAGMPGPAREKASAELRKFLKHRQGSEEALKIEAYLERLTGLPWSARTEDRLDIARAKQLLDDTHFGLAEVKERVLEFLAVRKKTGNKKGAILCFIGPPGVGKTSIASAIAEAMGRRFARLSLGGVNDETDLRGHGYTYLGSQPGAVARMLGEAGSRNPVMLLDEVDKMGDGAGRGDPRAALLEILDPKQNSTFRDRYLDVPFDLSEVLFVVTANELSAIPEPLLDRMELVEFPGYTLNEKIGIAQRHIVPEQRNAHGLAADEARLEDAAIRAVVEGHTLEAGVRSLSEKIGTIMRKIAAWIETRGEPAPGAVTEAAVEKYLGLPRWSPQEAAGNDVGVVAGLAVTKFGGMVSGVEVLAYEGEGKVTLRKQMGKMTDDSASNVLAYIRSRARELGIDPELFAKTNIDIYFDTDAEVDGPSAGITMATAMASALTGRKVKDGVAMTGKLSLRGQVGRIGGLKQKVMAAHRAGYHTVIFPEGNRREVETIPEDVRREMRLIPVSRVDEVFAEALEPASGAGAL